MELLSFRGDTCPFETRINLFTPILLLKLNVRNGPGTDKWDTKDPNAFGSRKALKQPQFFKDIFFFKHNVYPKCFQYERGMFIMPCAWSSSPNWGQSSAKAPGHLTACMTHMLQARWAAAAHPTVNVARMVRSSAELVGVEWCSQVKEDDNEAAALGPEDTPGNHSSWERAPANTAFRRETQWSSCRYQCSLQSIRPGAVPPSPPIPLCSPSGGHQLEYKSWGFWFCPQEGMACSILLGKRNQKRTMTELSDTCR